MRSQTVFPADYSAVSWRVLFYRLGRQEILDVSILNWVYSLLALVVLVWLSGWLPGGVWTASVLTALLLGIVVTHGLLSRNDFVVFDTEPAPQLAPQALTAKEKIGVHVTGNLTVHEKFQRFTWLPGFYRSFATREHALLCRCVERRFLLLARWPDEEIGLWYAFVQPQIMRQVRWGTLHFGNAPQRALAITYHVPRSSNARRLRRKPVDETLYLTCANDGDAMRILADLLVDQPFGASASE